MAYNTKLGYTFTTDGVGVKNHTYAEIDIDASTVTKTTWQYPEAETPEGNGLLSIAFNNDVETTPDIATFYPKYYDDLTDDEKTNGYDVSVRFLTGDHYPVPNKTYTVTITPTAAWSIIYFDENMEQHVAPAGESVTQTICSLDAEGNITVTNDEPHFVIISDPNDQSAQYVMINMTIALESN